MNTHTERPDATKRHNWTRLYAALDKLAIGETLTVNLGRDGALFINKARNAINRQWKPRTFTVETTADGNGLLITKEPPPF